MALKLALRWQADGQWYGIEATCTTGLTVVAGPSGPALLQALAGRRVPWAGHASLDGRPLWHGRSAARRGPTVRPVVAVLALDRLSPWCTPLGHVRAAVRRHGVRRWLARGRALQALRWTAAMDLARRPALLLDKEARQRVLLACALALVPGLLLLERPCAALPPEDRAALYATLRELALAWEMVVLVTPDAALGELPTLHPLKEPPDFDGAYA